MKLTSIQLTIIFLLSTSVVFGQRLKDKKAKFNYVSLPSEKLPDDYLTYSINIYGRTIVDMGVTSEAAQDRLSMDGFKRMDHYADNGAHIRAFVNTGYMRVGRTALKTKTNSHKDKETGKVTKTTDYWYSTAYSGNTSFKIYGPKGEILDSGTFPYNDTKTTKSYSSRAELNKRKARALQSNHKSARNDMYSSAVGAARKSLADKFDFKKRTESKELYIVKKHATTDDYEKYYEQIKKEWSTIDPCEGPDAYKTKFADALAFYEKEAQIQPGNKKQNRIFIGSNYNFALLSFYLGDFETAVKHANKVLKVDAKHKKSKRLIEGCQKINEKMELHGTKSMHYCRDVSDAKGPKEIAALEEAKEELVKNNDLSDGKVFLNGKEVTGTFQHSKEDPDLNFGSEGNVKFVSSTDETEVDLTSEEVSSFSIGKRDFAKMSFAPSAKGGSDAKMCILEKLYGSDKIALYKYYPVGGGMDEEQAEFAFQKAGQDDPVSLLSTDFLILKKGLAKYFGDCADLKTMCEEGTFDLKKADLIKAARIYSEVCE